VYNTFIIFICSRLLVHVPGVDHKGFMFDPVIGSCSGVDHKGFTFDPVIGSCSWNRSQRIYVWPVYWFMPGVDHKGFTFDRDIGSCSWSRSQRIYVWPVYWFMPGVDHMKLTRVLQYKRTQIHWQEVDQGIAVQPDTNPLTRSWPGYCSLTGHKSINMKLTRVLQFKCV